MIGNHRLLSWITLVTVLATLVLGATGAIAHKQHKQQAPQPVQPEQAVSSSSTDGAPTDSDGEDRSQSLEVSDHDDAGQSTGNQAPAFSDRLMSWLGSFHPAAVHVPIGLLLGALLAEIMLVATGNTSYAAAGRFCVRAGALGAALAMTFGWLYAGFSVSDSEAYLTTHRWVGTAAALWAMLLWPLSTRLSRGEDLAGRSVYRAALLVAAGLVAVNGYLGGLMVHGADHHAF